MVNEHGFGLGFVPTARFGKGTGIVNGRLFSCFALLLLCTGRFFSLRF